MKSSWGRQSAVLIGLAVIAAAAGLAWSRWYWGYWTSAPSVVAWVRALDRVEAVINVECTPGRAAQVTPVSESHVHRLGRAYLARPWDYPGDQLMAALEITAMRPSHDAVAPRPVERFCGDLYEAGVIEDGAPGYPRARNVVGAVAIGRTRAGETLYIGSVLGGEVSNDHHAVYDVEFAETPHGFTLRRQHTYFEDIAGIEGVRWWTIAALTFVGGAALLALTTIAIRSARYCARMYATLAR